MERRIPIITEFVRQLTEAAQPHIDTLHAHPLYDEDFANASGRLYMKYTNKIEEENAQNPLPFMADDEYNLFISCSMFWRDVYRVYSDAVVTKISVSRQIADQDKYGEGLILDPDAKPLEDVLRLAEQAEEKTQALMNQVEDIRTQLSLLAWVRYIESLAGDQKKIMSDIRQIAKCIERPNVIMMDESDPDQGRMFMIEVDHEYFAGRDTMLIPNNIADLPYNREKLTEDLKPMFYYHLRALDYYNLKTTAAQKVINTALTRFWSAAEAQNYSTTSLDTFYRTKDKVSNQLTLLEPDSTRRMSAESQKDKRKGKEIDVYATLYLSGIEEALEGSTAGIALNRLEPEDRQVLDAIVTVWENGERTTTIQTIYQIITKNPRSRLTPEKEEELLNRLRKLSLSYIKINASEESQYYGGQLKDQMEGTIISITLDTSYVNGALTYNTVHILDLEKSPVYRYAKIKKQIAAVPFKYLDTKSANKNRETTLIEDCLIDKIESIEHTGDTILIRTILDAAGIHEEGQKDFKKKRQRTIKKITAILDGYVSTGYIISYKINAKGRSKVHSITIRK